MKFFFRYCSFRLKLLYFYFFSFKGHQFWVAFYRYLSPFFTLYSLHLLLIKLEIIIQSFFLYNWLNFIEFLFFLTKKDTFFLICQEFITYRCTRACLVFYSCEKKKWKCRHYFIIWLFIYWFIYFFDIEEEYSRLKIE